MDPLTFTCPACGRRLSYDYEQAGDPYECPGCGSRGTLPGIPLAPLDEEIIELEDEEPAAVPLQGGPSPPPPRRVSEQELLQEEEDRRARARRRRRDWRPVHRGLTWLLGSWLAVTLLATLLLMGIGYMWLRVLFPLSATTMTKEAVGVFGILFVLAESAALYGYRQCLNAPVELGLHGWAWAALLLAVGRCIACLSTSIVYLVVSMEHKQALGTITLLTAGLFFGQWFLATLLLRAVAYTLQTQWLLKMARRQLFLLSGLVLSGSALLCGFQTGAGGTKEGFEKLGMFEGAALQICVSCGGAALSFLLWLAVVGHLRLLNYLRGSIET
jgi:hypothetical protein